MHRLSWSKRASTQAGRAITVALLVVWSGLNAPISLHGQGTSQAANNLHPDISPDGTRIVFESDRDGNSEIYVMDIDGSNPRRLTNNPAIDTAPVWSRDGKQILFRSTRETERHPWPYYAMNSEGTEPVKVDDVDDLADVFRDWSPDGSRILYKARRADRECCDIFVMDATGANQTRLAEKGFFHRWLPDGSKIIYFSSISGSYQIYRMDPDGSNKQQLTH